MAGTSLVCRGFIETETYLRSKADLQQLFNLTDREVDERLEALIWAIARDASANTERIPDRNLWVAVTPWGTPPLRIFLRPRRDVPGECELLWIEERL